MSAETMTGAGAGVSIGSHQVGPDQPVFLIAEIGINHNGDPRLAERMIREAFLAGASAVKFQCFSAESLVVEKAGVYAVKAEGTQMDLFRRMELSDQAWRDLKSLSDRLGVLFFASVFSEDKVDFLESMNVDCYKIASGDLTYVQLLRKTARTGKAIILSTGMSTLDEVEEAVEVIESEGNRQRVLLHCVNNYPTQPRDAHLRKMEALRQFRCPVGFSDHTDGIEISLAAIAMGACAIEKHFTIDRALPGPDQHFSMTPDQLRELRRMAENIRTAAGSAVKCPADSEAESRRLARRSVVAVRNIPAGREISADAVGIKRPGTGIAPKDLEQILGKIARRDIARGDVLSWDMLSA
ncbi:N-acetylneuraminate synthase family protein [bacterium]|nr:N-acetylneuraminate synthase family protein [bacterium]